MVLIVGCTAELAPPAGQAAVALTFEPAAEPDAVPPVVRLHVPTWTDPSTLRLFRGELSDYHVGRVRAGELPNTLLEREVPALAYADSARAVSAPLEVLAPDVYSLASAELGLIGSFVVSTNGAPPVLERIWPPAGAVTSAAVYCGAQAPSLELEVTLEPVGVAARLASGLAADGLFGDRCLRLAALEPLEPGAVALPPPLAGEVLLDPSPWHGGEPSSVIDAACASGEARLALACAAIGDDRLVLRADQPLLVVFREPSPALVLLETPGRGFVVQGLPPDRELWLSGEVLDVAGRAAEFRELVHTAPAQPRVVINEVLANAAGAEPAQEWIELYNDGSVAVELAGYRLEDGGGSVTLPAYSLAPGAFVVLVSEDYVADAAVDVTPPGAASVLVMSSLAKNGLSNSGELLRLYDAEDVLVSRFPALKASDAGVSVARRTPASPDDDPASFGGHAPPGASPGAPNTLEE